MIPGPTANYKLAHRYLSLAHKKATLDFQIAEIEQCYGKMNKDGLGIPKNSKKLISILRLLQPKATQMLSRN